MKNELYLDHLKSLSQANELNAENKEYPNIQNFFIKNNFLIYQNFNLDLNDLELFMLDPRLFSFEINEILFILKNMVINLKDPYFIQKEINYMTYLENSKELTEKQKKYIYDYLDDFYKKHNIRQKYNYQELAEELNTRIKPINEAYLNENDINSKYHNPASQFIREIELTYNNTLNTDVEKNTGLRLTLVRKNGSILPNAYEYEGLEHINRLKENGFAYNIVMVIITMLIGIMSAITFYFL